MLLILRYYYDVRNIRLCSIKKPHRFSEIQIPPAAVGRVRPHAACGLKIPLTLVTSCYRVA